MRQMKMGDLAWSSELLITPSVKAIKDAPFLSASQKRDILYNNAARFLRLTKEQVDRHHGR